VDKGSFFARNTYFYDPHLYVYISHIRKGPKQYVNRLAFANL